MKFSEWTGRMPDWPVIRVSRATIKPTDSNYGLLCPRCQCPAETHPRPHCATFIKPMAMNYPEPK